MAPASPSTDTTAAGPRFGVCVCGGRRSLCSFSMASDREWREAWLEAERYAFGDAAAERDPATALRALVARAPDGFDVDRYGGGELAERLERRVAELLGKEAAVWMPSGTMAQQIALRIHADRTGRSVVAFHPQCHLEAHEEGAYRVLHGLRAALLGGRERLIETKDVEELREPIAAPLLELPQRDLGGELPPWDDLVATCEAARVRGAALHLDGARLWQCGPFYGRSWLRSVRCSTRSTSRSTRTLVRRQAARWRGRRT